MMSKELGQVFTPDFIVEKIINLTNYNNDCINKKILEPSFGEGAFLNKIIEKLIEKCKKLNYSDDEIKKQLEENIYGIEIDKELYDKTLQSLKKLLSTYGLVDVKLNLFNVDALDFKKNIKFDYILGNPPYVRIHNLDENTRNKIKDYEFSKGNTDLYIIFFELCINLLNENGKLGFITPNSYLKNTSQKNFRNYLLNNKLITHLIDFKSNKIFNNVGTYTAITILNNSNKTKNINYIYSNGTNDLIKNKFNYDDLINKEWSFSNNKGTKSLKDICNAQHGIATNADKIYISEIKEKTKNTVLFNGYEIEKDILIKIIKGSKYNGEEITQRLLFPYIYKDNKYIPMEEKYIKENFPLAYKYLLDNKEKLEERDLEKNIKWYQFARSQSINTINKKKIVIKHIIPQDDNFITFYEIPENVAIYSGVYITSENNFDKIKKIISTKEFCNYCKNSGKDMSGGYKSISAKNIKEYKFD